MRKFLHTDSRSVFIPEETIFVALHTGLADGHKYIPELYQRGVREFIVARDFDTTPFPDASFTFVDDTLGALRDMAAQSLAGAPGIRQIVITGSRGKTTVKELIFRALVQDNFAVARSPRSWNSRIGVPAGIIENVADAPEGIIITEVGIDGPGQAEYYHSLLHPKIGILTPIDSEHDEAFKGGHEEKIREKLQLLKGAETIIYDDCDNAVAPLVAEILPDSKAIAVRGIKALATAALDEITEHRQSGCSATKIGQQPYLSTRIDVEDVAYDSVLIYDRFTHDPRSLRDALDFMRRRFTPHRRNTVIFSDFSHAPSLNTNEVASMYAEAGELLRAFGVERVITIGPESKRFFDLTNFSKDSASFENTDALRTAIESGFLGREQLFLLKADPRFEPQEISSLIEQARHDTTLEVDLDALLYNYNYYRSLLPEGTGLVVMVKASAYGLGSLEIAKTLQSAGAAYLAVAVVDEGVALRKAGVTMPIIILNPMTNKYGALFSEHLELAVFSVDELQRLLSEAALHDVRTVDVHIKLDTGMHRLGFTQDQLTELISLLHEAGDKVRVRSIFSHLATADCLDMDEYTTLQRKNFEEMSSELLKALPYRTDVKRHLLNTAGIERFGRTGSAYDMGRLGLGLYGISPVAELPSGRILRPVARLVSTIISLKTWPAGTPIGYGCRGVTTRPSVIATVPIGYADGLNRHFGRGQANFLVRGVECPTIGNICMDLCMIDVTDVHGVKVGDEVEIFGPSMPVERLAETLDTIPYEILTSVSPRVHRAYLKH
ncbi:MAG: alanine racemase [Muribaculaceae bacterium]|nr:alanine racemase [Muribaculaceae bacterium]